MAYGLSVCTGAAMHDEPFPWETPAEIRKIRLQLFGYFCFLHWRIALAAFALFLFCIWHTVLSVYLSYHRKVIVIGARSKEYEVVINDRPVRLKPLQHVELDMAEGDFEIRPSAMAGNLQPSTIRLETSFWDRPYQSVLFVINPDRLAILRNSDVFYGRIGKSTPEQSYFCNTNGAVITGVDHAFEPPARDIVLTAPSKLLVNGVARRRLEILTAITDRDRAEFIEEILPADEAKSYLNRWLEDQPENAFAKRARRTLEIQDKKGKISETMRPAQRFDSDEKSDKGLTNRPVEKPQLKKHETESLRTAPRFDFRETTKDEFKKRLNARPLSISWHRAYQDTFLQNGEEQSLVDEYRKLSESMPHDNAARYLLSRVSSLEEETRLLAESIKNGHPAPDAHFVLGCRFLAQARFHEAVKEMRLVDAERLDYPDFRRYTKLAFLGAKDKQGYMSVASKEPTSLHRSVHNQIEIFRFESIFDKNLAVNLTKKGISVPVFKEMSRTELEKFKDIVKARYQIATALALQDTRGYLGLVSKLAEPISPIRLAILQNNVGYALTLLEAMPSSMDSFYDKALLLLAQPSGKETANWVLLKESFVEEMGKRRHEKVFQQMIEDEIPFDMNLIRKAACDPECKRILVYLTAKWMPDHAEELRSFAQELDFPCDEISLCLKKINP